MAAGVRSWIWRSLVSVAALLCLWDVLAAAVNSMPPNAETRFARILGRESTDAQLIAIGDKVATSRGSASAEELAWVRGVAVSRPLSALPFYIVAVSNAAAERGRARSLVGLALERDPRLIPAVFWEFDDRLVANDVPAATRALIRLIVLNPREQRYVTLLTQLATIPEARTIIKDSIVHGAFWRGGFLNTLGGSNVDTGVQFELFDIATKSPSGAATPEAMTAARSAFIESMLARKDYERAYLAWTLWLPSASQDATGYIFDGNFAGRDSLPPFGWNLTDGAGGAVTIEHGAGLSVDYSGTDGAVLAKQTLLLPGGHYRMVTKAIFQPVQGDDATPLAWHLTCLPDRVDLLKFPVPLSGKTESVASDVFEVGGDCHAQLLTLEAGSADFAKHLAGKISSVSIEATK